MSFGKGFWKTNKKIEDKGKKQVDGLESLKTKTITYKSDDDNTPISKDVYDEISEERMDEILEMSRQINYSNLVYDFKGLILSINFGIFEGPMYTYDQLKNSEKALQQLEEEQKYFKKDLNEITSGNPKHKSEKQSYTIKNVRNLYYLRQKLVNLLNDNAKIASEAIYKSKGEGLKILTPKQMLHRLLKALGKVKAGNNSERLLNKIKQIVYSLYQSKKISKKVYNNLIKST